MRITPGILKRVSDPQPGKLSYGRHGAVIYDTSHCVKVKTVFESSPFGLRTHTMCPAR